MISNGRSFSLRVRCCGRPSPNRSRLPIRRACGPENVNAFFAFFRSAAAMGGPDGAAARLGLKRTTLQSKFDHLGIPAGKLSRLTSPIAHVRALRNEVFFGHDTWIQANRGSGALVCGGFCGTYAAASLPSPSWLERAGSALGASRPALEGTAESGCPHNILQPPPNAGKPPACARGFPWGRDLGEAPLCPKLIA
jgi:hypothetical protein